MNSGTGTRQVQLEIVKVMRTDKLSHKTFLVRRLDEDQDQWSPSTPSHEDSNEGMVDTAVNDSSAGVGEKLQVMKLFDRSLPSVLCHLKNEVSAVTKLVGKRNCSNVEVLAI